MPIAASLLCCAAAVASAVWSVADANGQRVDHTVAHHAEASVFLFLAPDCPRSERAQPALRELQATFQSRGVHFFAVAPGVWPAADSRAMAQRLPVPLLLDARMALTRVAGARVTPEAVVLNRAGSVRYRGAVEGVSDALEAVFAHRPTAPWPRALGCAINLVAAAAGPTNYYTHAAPILNGHCVECHRAGGNAPFALDSYAQAAPRAAAIADAVTTRRMPPWKPDPGPPHFLGERRLASAEVETLAAWARAGAPQGTSREQAPVPVAAFAPPDHVTAMRAPFRIPAGGPDLYRCFVLPAG
ncbi:MAG: redoxin domain-containing protein, partial [Acidobacteria bacterium]|nr:redoxin domain-containing protein [Acidobacteriota bacterium]